MISNSIEMTRKVFRMTSNFIEMISIYPIGMTSNFTGMTSNFIGMTSNFIGMT